MRKISTPFTNDYITCQLRGRTGNMMFQLAHGYIKALKYNRQFIVPNENGVNIFKNNLFRKFDFFNVNLNNDIIHGPFEYEILEPNDGRPTVFEGYYQSEKYYEGYDEVIKDLYSPTFEFIDRAIKDYPFLLNSTVSAINVRRGDYLTQPRHHPVITNDYINESYKHLPPHDVLLVVSDDIEWCKENIKLPNVVFNDNNKYFNHESLWLLSLCDHFIISNSTFSWWGAWLSRTDNKVVISPDTWFGPDITVNPKDIWCDNWIKIPTKWVDGFIELKN